jgi:phosphoenolpyruvate synthase/pyruvate phosphate dikinase
METNPKRPTQAKPVAFLFDETENSAAVLGNKGAGLVELVSLGMRVPYGFTIGTAVARVVCSPGLRAEDAGQTAA